MIIVTDRRERFNPKEAQLSPAQALLALCKVLTDTFPRRYVECVRQEGETLRVVVTEEVSPLNTTTFQGTQKEMERLLKATATFIRTIHFYHNRCKNVDEKSTDILLPFFTNNQTFDWPFTS
jgi:nucleoside-triphosphatase THEP1